LEKGKSCRVPDLSNKDGTEQLCCLWPGTLAQSKQSEWKHYNGRATNLQCTTSPVVFAAHLPIDVQNI